MPRLTPRSPRTATGLAAAAVCALLPSGSAQAVIGVPGTGTRAHTARITVGAAATARGCSATLVAGDRLLGAKSRSVPRWPPGSRSSPSRQPSAAGPTASPRSLPVPTGT
ncbi:hypothetical protein [Streptomyces omiyaensis]|uniref:Uncharacterized protein n=1 Tax=Streptomyces omiyaensis TaxID=68247 RepID=A0ABW7BTG3_9ACTN